MRNINEGKKIYIYMKGGAEHDSQLGSQARLYVPSYSISNWVALSSSSNGSLSGAEPGLTGIVPYNIAFLESRFVPAISYSVNLGKG